jgi:hypothetical protein
MVVQVVAELFPLQVMVVAEVVVAQVVVAQVVLGEPQGLTEQPHMLHIPLVQEVQEVTQ